MLTEYTFTADNMEQGLLQVVNLPDDMEKEMWSLLDAGQEDAIEWRLASVGVVRTDAGHREDLIHFMYFPKSRRGACCPQQGGSSDWTDADSLDDLVDRWVDRWVNCETRWVH